MRDLVKAVAVLSVFFAVAIVSKPTETAEPEPTETLYDCKLVRTWEEEKFRGIDEYQRIGRPAANKHEHKACLSGWKPGNEQA